MAPEAYNISKTFSDIIELDLYNVSILDCQTKTCNVSANNDNEKEITVLGDYEVLIRYSKSSEDRKSYFTEITVRKEICETIPFEIEDKTLAALSLQPSCTLSYKSKARPHSIWEIRVLGWEIEVLGEINIAGTLNKAIDAADNANSIEKTDINSPLQHTGKKQIESRVWQFEGINGITMEQLMDMDLESLEKIAK